jgi:UDP-N-acetylmuramoyl-tripeptide--D-alanyl-D-alanine ligase
VAGKVTVFNLDEVEKAIGGRIFGRKRVRGIQGVSIDSRTLRPGDLFFAIRGQQNDGHNFVKEAQEKGASAFVVEISAIWGFSTVSTKPCTGPPPVCGSA